MDRFPRELRHGSGVLMTLEPSRLLLVLRELLGREEVETRLAEAGLVLEDAGDDRKSASRPTEQVINHTEERFWARSRTGGAIDSDDVTRLESAFGEAFAWVGPVYRLDGSQGRDAMVCPLPYVLVVRPIEGRDDDVRKALGHVGMQEVVEKSRYLGEFLYFESQDLRQTQTTAYELQNSLLQGRTPVARDARFENMPMVQDYTIIPNDPLLAQQWGMTQIAAGGAGLTAWDISTGVAGVVIAVLDSGCDLTHPDLVYSPLSINLGTMMPGSGGPVAGGGHGTACAGIVAGTFNNALGVAGVAGSCVVMALARQNSSDVEVAAGINYAAANGARAISMSFGRYAPGEGFGPTGWDFTLIDPAIQNAVNVSGLVLLAATGNENTNAANRYPSRHALVIACGASDQADNRKSPASPDGETWGSNFAEDVHLGVTTGVDVVAPGVLIPTTDIQGTGGYNNAAGTAGDFVLNFNGTSAATPHVAGLAGLLMSQSPGLTNAQVRSIIERTAEKVGTVAYAEDPNYPNGTRNQQMGYGRINALRALDLADLMIRDWPGDTGVEPSSPAGGNFWRFSDVVVRIFDDNVFEPHDPSKSNSVERGQTNFIYVRVTNNGPREARNITVETRITPFVGLQFVYPDDWTLNDAMHVAPTPVTTTFPTLAAGASVIAKSTVSAAQVETLWGWIDGMSWHPCLLASVTSDNDYAFATGVSGTIAVMRRNNLAQRNLSVIDVLADDDAAVFPFVAGHRRNADRVMEIMVDRRRVPANVRVLLSLDEDDSAFPEVDLSPPPGGKDDEDGKGIIFRERTRIETTLGCCRGILTLEKGSRFDCAPRAAIGKATVQGGVITIEDERRFVEIREGIAVVRMEKQPNALHVLALHTRLPADVAPGTTIQLDVAQRDAAGQVVGGASAVYTVT